MLGISPSAWLEAKQAMGERHAAITLAAMNQRSEKINNAGGYLRSLTEKAQAGKFSTWPMIMALLNAELNASKIANTTGAKPRSEDQSRQYAVSDALLKSLERPKR